MMGSETLARRRRSFALPLIVGTSLLAHGDLATADGLVFRLPYFGQTSYAFTNTSLATYRAENFDPNLYDNNFLSLTERYDSVLQAAPWRLQLRIDAFAPVLRFPHVAGAAPSPWLPSEVPGGCAPPTCVDYLRPDLRVERVALRYQRGALTADFGDYYFVLGRGVALSFRKIDPLGIDTTLRGAHFDVDLGPFTVRGFGGYANPQNLDPITLRVDHDWGGSIAAGNGSLRPGPDVLGGGEIAARIGPDEDVEFALDALRVHFPESPIRDYDVDVLGYRASAPALLDGTLSLHTEVQALRRTQSVYRTTGPDAERGMLANESARFGRAVYGSAQLTRDNWTALLEWKDYTNYIVSPDGAGADARRVYSAAPSLERDDVQFLTNSNVRGGRLRLERAFRPSPWLASLTAVAHGASEDTTKDPWSNQAEGVVHGYLTLRRRGRTAPVAPPPGAAPAADIAGRSNPARASTSEAGGSGPVTSAATGGIGGTGPRVTQGEWQLLASAGYRHEFLLGPRGGRDAGAPEWQIAHGDIDVAFALGMNDSLELRLDGRLERRATGNPVGSGLPVYSVYTRSGLAVTWSHKDRLQVSAVARVDNTAEAVGRNDRPRELQSMGLPHDPIVPWFYPAAEVRYMFSPGNTIRVFGGMTPGGKLCTGGVCRDVPPFQGGIAELVLRM